MARDPGTRTSTGKNPSNGDPWRPYPPRGGPAGRWFGPGNAVGEQSLDGAINELHDQHPWHVQGENLQDVGSAARHRPVTSRTYGPRESLPNGSRIAEDRADWRRWSAGGWRSD